MVLSRKRDCMLPTGWTADQYWDVIDRVIQTEPEAKILFKDGPYYWPSRNPHPVFRLVKRGAKYIVTQTSHTENIPYALINQLELNVESHSRTLLCTQTTHPKSGQIVQESFQERFDQQDF